MNEDYLWDKSGEPDPEIVRLEQTLGRLRYKRPVEPLPLPMPSRSWLRPSFSPMLAIAATLVILLLAGGLWLGLHRSSSSGVNNAREAGTAPQATPSQQITSGPPPHVGPIETTAGVSGDKPSPKSTGVGSQPNKLAPRVVVARRQEVASVKSPSRARREQMYREGELAKEQLIKALLITSDKLNAVQKKIQGTQEHGPIS